MFANESPAKTGWLCKRYFRVNRWSERYFVLVKDRIYYYTSQDQNKEPRGKFDLVKGCIIGNITEVDTPTKKLKRHGDKVFSFTILWPEGYGMPKKRERRRHARQDRTAGRAGNAPPSVEVVEYGSDGDGFGSGEELCIVGDTATNYNNHGSFLPARNSDSADGGSPNDDLSNSSSAAAMVAGVSLARRAAAHAQSVKARMWACPAPEQLQHSSQQQQQLLGSGTEWNGAAEGGGGAAVAAAGGLPGSSSSSSSGGGGGVQSPPSSAAAPGGSLAASHHGPKANRLVLAARCLEEARQWKVALEHAVAQHEGRRPLPPVNTATAQRGLKLMKAWADRSACDWRSEGLLHGTRLLRCVPLKIPLAADETAGHTSDNTAAAAAAAAAATTARAESVAAAQLMTQTALGVGARRVSVPVRAAPLDVFLTLMAALDGGAPGMALSKTGDNDARSGGGSGGSGGSRKPDSEGQLASSVFRAVLGRSVASVEIIDKLDDHTDVLRLCLLPNSSADEASHGTSLFAGSGAKQQPVSAASALLGAALGALIQHVDSGYCSCNDASPSSTSIIKRNGSSSNNRSAVPRELVVERFWRVDENGSFLLTLTSVEPELAYSTYGASSATTPREKDGSQPPHALASLDLTVLVAPRRDYPAFGTSVRGADECRLEVTCSGSPGGAAAALRTAAENTRLWGQQKNHPSSSSGGGSGSSNGNGSTSTIPLFSGTVGDAAGAVLRGAASALEAAYQRRLLALLTIDLKATAESLAVAPAFVFAPSRALHVNPAYAKKFSSGHSPASSNQALASPVSSEAATAESETTKASLAAAAAAATTATSPNDAAAADQNNNSSSAGGGNIGAEGASGYNRQEGVAVGTESIGTSLSQRPRTVFDGGAWMLAAALAPLATGSLGGSSNSGKGTASAQFPPLFPTPRPPGFFFGDRTVSSVEHNGCELSAAGFTCVGSDDALSDGGAGAVDDDDDEDEDDEDEDDDDEDDEDEDDIEGISDGEKLGGDDSDEDSEEDDEEDDDDDDEDDDDADEAMAAIEAEVLLAEAEEKDDDEGGSSSCGDGRVGSGSAAMRPRPKWTGSEDDDEDDDSDSELEGGLGVEDEALAMVEAMAAAMEEEKLEEVATRSSAGSSTGVGAASAAATATQNKEARMARRWRRYRKLKRLFKRSAKRERARTLEESNFPFGGDGLGRGESLALSTTASAAAGTTLTPSRSSLRRNVRRGASTALSPSVHPLLATGVPSPQPSPLPSPRGHHGNKSGKGASSSSSSSSTGNGFSFDMSTPRASRNDGPTSSPALNAVELSPELPEPPPLLAATPPGRRTWGLSSSSKSRAHNKSKASGSPGSSGIAVSGLEADATESDPRVEQAELRAMALSRERDVFLLEQGINSSGQFTIKPSCAASSPSASTNSGADKSSNSSSGSSGSGSSSSSSASARSQLLALQKAMDLLASAKSALAQHEHAYGILMLDDHGGGGEATGGGGGVLSVDFEGGSMDSGANETVGRSTYRKRLREAIQQRMQRRRTRRAAAKAKRKERRAARATAKALRHLNETPEERALRVSRRKRLYARYKARRRARAQARETKRAVKRAAKRFKQYGLRYVGQGDGSSGGHGGGGETYGPGDLPRAGVPPGPPLPIGALPRHLALARDPRFFRAMPADDLWRLALSLATKQQQQQEGLGGPVKGKSALPAHWIDGGEAPILPAKASTSHKPWLIVALLVAIAIAFTGSVLYATRFAGNGTGDAPCASPIGRD